MQRQQANSHPYDCSCPHACHCGMLWRAVACCESGPDCLGRTTPQSPGSETHGLSAVPAATCSHLREVNVLDVVCTVVVSNLPARPVNRLHTEQLALRHLTNLRCSRRNGNLTLLGQAPSVRAALHATLCQPVTSNVCHQSGPAHRGDVWMPSVMEGFGLFPWLLADVNSDQGCGRPGRHFVGLQPCKRAGQRTSALMQRESLQSNESNHSLLWGRLMQGV